MGFYAEKIFPRFYDRLVKGPGLDAGRRRLVPLATGRVLEIGIGTGLNLRFYSERVVSVHGVDPNPGMLRRLSKRLGEAPCPVIPVRAGAEALPFPDESFDTVLCTHVLCSVGARAEGLAEIRRVLRRDGRFVFVEHGLSPDPAIARWQRRLNRLQRRLAVGCTLDQQPPLELDRAGFRIDALTEAYCPDILRTHGYLYEGIARRDERSSD